MHLHSYRLRNFRRLRDVHVELASDISIFVGANNSGKTSATQAVQMFLSGGKDAFSLYDFSSHVWSLLDEIGEREGEVAETEFPTISLDLWFEVGAEDLYLVIPHPAFYRLGRNTRWRPRRIHAEEYRRIDPALPRRS
jgi:predicted ATPase